MDKKLTVRRGNYATGWYMVNEEKQICSEVKYHDWCIFDEDGNIALSKGHILCVSTKWVATIYATEWACFITGWGRPIDCPIRYNP